MGFQQSAFAQCNPEFLYDKVISGYHSSIALDTNGHYLLWGQDIANDGTENEIVPVALNSTNFPLLTTAVLKATIGGFGKGGSDQFIALTSGGLYAWSTEGHVFANSLTSSATMGHVGTITGGDATTSLPSGVTPSSVTMMFATDSTLALVISDGSVWVITQGAASMQGDNTALSATTWHKVKINSTTYLSGVTAIRGQYSNRTAGALMALTSTGQVYTWGPGIYKGDGTARTSSAYAVPMTLPTEFSASNVPKMIAVTGGQANSFACFNTYYLVSKTTGVIYTLGDNQVHQCGDFTGTERKNWAAVLHSSTASDTLKNMSFISVMDHNGAGASPGVIAIGDTGNIYTFGYNNSSMLGQNASYTKVDPSIPRGFTPGTDKGLFAEVGGHTGVYLKQGSYNFCYCGHFAHGSAGNNSIADDIDSVFDCSSTPLVGLCGGVPVVPSLTTSTITATPTSIAADSVTTSIITVQLKTAGGVNLTKSGGAVIVTTTSGHISTVTDNNDGTYTATLISSHTAGTATLGFSLLGVASTSTTSVTYTSVAASTSKSTISANPTSIAADGSSTSTITVQLEDASGTNITSSDGTVTISTNAGTLGTVTDNADGTYTVTLTSANTASTATLSFSINGVAATNTTTVNFISAVGNTTTSTISANPTSITADGSSTSTITVQLEDGGGTDITTSAGTVTVSTDNGTLGTVTDNTDGTYSVTLTSSTTVITATLSFSINGVAATNTATVGFTALVASPVTSTISASPTTLAADGSSTSVITVQLETAGGTNITESDGTVVISTDQGSVGTTTDNGDGTYSATLTSGNTATTANLSFSINGTPATNTTTVNFTPWASPITSTISANPTSIAADGSSTSTITVQLENGAGTNLTGSTGTVTVSTDNGTLGTVTDNSDGTYSVTLTSSNTITTANLTFSINGIAATNTATVNFTPWGSPINSTISASPTSIAADGSSTSTITVQLENAVGASLTQSAGTVTVSTNNGSLGTVTDNADGTYSVTLTSANTVSTATLTFSINGIAATNTTTVNFTACSPVIVFDPKGSTACTGGNAIFIVTASGTALNYHWQEDAGSGYADLTDGGVYSGVLTSSLTLTGVAVAMNNYVYRCVVSNACNPSTPTDGATLTVNNVPSSTGAGNGGAICNGGTASLTSNSSDATSWSWAGSDGFASSDANPTATPTITTTYSLTISSGGNGCQPTNVYTTSVTVKNVPSSSGPTNSGPICVGGSVWLHAHSSDATSWSWTGSDGYTGSAPYAHLSPTTTTTYSLTVSSAGSGCQPETIYTTVVTVKNVPSSEGVTNGGMICVGGTASLNSNSSDATSWSWVGSNGYTSTDTNPTLTPTATATYSLTLSSAGNGCQPTTVYTTSITVNNVPVSTGATNAGAICKGGTAALHANSSYATIWSWTGPGGYTSSLNNPSPTPTVTSTYSLTLSSVGNGCQPATVYTTSVTVKNVPASSGVTNSGTICIGGTEILASNSSAATAWSWTSSNGFVSSSQNPVFTPTVTATYSLTVSSVGNGCQPATVYTTNVTVNNVPVSSGVTNSGPICKGGTVTLSANTNSSTNTWVWIGSDGFASVSENPTATPTVTTSYTLLVGGTGSGCHPTATYNTTVIVNNVPLSSGVTNGGAICVGGTAALFANSSYATAWSWIGSDGYTSPAQNPTPTPTVTTTYSLTVSSTGSGCNPATVYTTSVTVKSVPTAEPSTSAGTVCMGTMVNLSANSSAATAWSWIGSDGFTSTLQNPSETPTVSATYSLTVSSTGSGCSPETIYTTSVIVNNQPTSTGATNGGAICKGGTATLAANSSYATSWSWTGGGGFTSSSQNPSATPTVTTTYSLTLSSVGTGCSPATIYTTTVTVKNVPSSTGVTNGGAICAGGTATLNSNSSSATAWSWHGSDGFSSGLQNPTTTPTATTTYSLTLSSVGSGCQPENIYTTSVTVNNVPTSTGATNNGPICSGGTVILNSNSSYASTWFWVGTDGFVSTSANPTDNPTTTTVYTLLVGGTGSGCHPGTTYTTTVIVNNTPASSGVTNSSPICVGGTATLNSNSSYASSWTWVGSDGFTSSATNPVASPTATTTYSLTLSSAGIGCSPSTIYTTSIVVNNVPSSAGPTNSSPMCVGGTVTLNPNSSDATSWSWTGSDGSASSLSNPVATLTVTTTYSLTVSSVGDGCSPETVYTTSVTVNNIPSSTGPSNNGAICTGATATLSANTADATSWNWTGPDGYTTSLQNPSVTPPLTTTYSLTISSNGSGCYPDSIYITTVVVNPLPELISGAAAICAGGTLSLTHDGDGTWSSGNLSTATIDSVSGIATGISMGTATITYTLPTSCITTTVMTVNPAPATPIITTASTPTLCSSTYFQNFGTDVAPLPDEYYSWSATNGDIMATGHLSQYSIVNFSTPGAAVVTLTATLNETNCTSSTQYALNVDGKLTDNPIIIYSGGQFICLLNNVSHYQWGYDDAYTLDSATIDGQVNQSYFLDSPDFAHKYYWAMTTDLTTGCVKKGYYRVPTGVTNINEEVAAEIKVFPNPAQAYVTVEIETTAGGNKEVEVINLLGQKVATLTANNNRATIDVSGFAAGYYFVKCYNNGVNIGTAKFIKN